MIRKIVASIGGLLLVGLLVFLSCQFLVWRVGNGRIYTVESVPVIGIAIVPGASVLRSGKPSDILADRLKTAVQLYENKKVETILLSGDNSQEGYDEVNVMRTYILNLDVAPEDIFLDHAGLDTYDTLYRAHQIFGINEAIIVSQSYHLPRALYLADAIGMDVVGVSSDLQPYLKQSLFTWRERFANVKAVFDAMTDSRPEYLGEQIDITGDGRVTWDLP